MFLKNLNIIQFKNIEQASIGFCHRINCFSGNNGAGKTTLLDAIHYLSLCKSYFNASESINILWEKDFFVIEGHYERDNLEEDIYCGVKRNQRKLFKRNKKEYERLADHIGLLPLVMVSPADISLIIEGSEERRRFLNGIMSQFDHPYLECLISYNRLLAQRNQMLKEPGKSSFRDLLQIIDEQLVYYGTIIYEKRKGFLEKLLPVFQAYYNRISQGNEQVELVYKSQLMDGDFANLLKNARERDLATQFSTVGIHKDDLLMQLSDNPIRRIGSQGQQKTFLVALKLAEFQFIRDVSGMYPILLLDDIFDKFDDNRVRQIMDIVANQHEGQIFITDTDSTRLNRAMNGISDEHKIFNVDKGIVTEV